MSAHGYCETGCFRCDGSPGMDFTGPAGVPAGDECMSPAKTGPTEAAPTPIPPDDDDTRRWLALTDRVIELEQQLRQVTAYYHATHVLPECVSWQDCNSEPCRTVRPMLGVKHEH